MKKLCLLLAAFVFFNWHTIAQNVGIGTTTPGFPLNFSNALGDKISLYGNSGNHYGFGIQGGLFQMYSDAAAANITFGYGSSGAFTERVRIINSGADALFVNGRIVMRNGTLPNDPNQGPGIWIYKPDNLGQILGGFGAQNNQNMGFYGGPAGWGFTYDAVNSRVGIGNQNPNAPLSFPAFLGRKITLYPGATGNVGLSVHGNEFRIHTDYEPADITLGYENLAGVFTERFRFRGNGAMVVNGNSGTAGQFLSSNGNAAPPTWKTFAMTDYINTIEGGSTVISMTGSTIYDLTNSTVTLNLARAAKVLLFTRIALFKSCGVGTCDTKALIGVSLNGTSQFNQAALGANYGAEPFPQFYTTNSYGPDFFDLAAGNHTFTFTGRSVFNDPQLSFSARLLIIYNN